MFAVVAAAACACALAACGERHDVEHHTWTLFEMQRALHAGRNVAMGPSFPDGMSATAFLTAGDGVDTLVVAPVFAEGQTAAVVTTEIWVNYEDVWLQPGFLQMTDLNRPDPYLRNADGTLAPLLIDVGPDSTFYSPFWAVDLAVVGDVDPDHYRSTRALREAGVETQAIEPRACPLRPLDPPVLGAAPGKHPVEPWGGTELPDIPARTAWIDGTKLGLFDFGPGVFETEQYPHNGTVVEPLPIFLFYAADATGVVRPLPMAPKVAGVAELFSGGAAEVDADPTSAFTAPHFGAFWRIHKAVLPAKAAAFHAAEHPGVAPAGVALGDYEGRVALDGACFAAADFPAGCGWLDSQAKIEEALGHDAITPTELMATCPFVFYGGKPVKR